MTFSQLSFSGGGLDRRAHLRDEPKTLTALFENAKILPVWRGKPLVHYDQTLGWIAAEHALLDLAQQKIYFLGQTDEQAYFAADISEWEPKDEPKVVDGFFDDSAQTHPDLGSDCAFLELRGIMLTLSPLEGELAVTAKALVHWNSVSGFCSACGAAAHVQKAGWQRTCAGCGLSHFPRTDPVVIMLVTRGNQALIGRSHAWPKGMYSCLAGFIEPGETLEAAVEREVFEEAGITVEDVRYHASQPWHFQASLMFGCVARAISEKITLDPVELEDARWITKEEMMQVMAGHHPEITPARKGAIAHHLISAWLAGTY